MGSGLVRYLGLGKGLYSSRPKFEGYGKATKHPQVRC